VSAERQDVQQFEIDEAIRMIRDDFGDGKIDAACMEREIDLALRGRRGECGYLSIFAPPRLDRQKQMLR
jgi:hypothetical protein